MSASVTPTNSIMSRMNRGMSVPGRYACRPFASVASSAMARLRRPELLEQARVGVDAEPRPLGHRDAAILGMDRVVQRVVGEVAVEALDRRLARERRDAVNRREQPRAE